MVICDYVSVAGCGQCHRPDHALQLWVVDHGLERRGLGAPRVGMVQRGAGRLAFHVPSINFSSAATGGR